MSTLGYEHISLLSQSSAPSCHLCRNPELRQHQKLDSWDTNLPLHSQYWQKPDSKSAVPTCVRVLTVVIVAQPPGPPSLHYSKHRTVSAEMLNTSQWNAAGGKHGLSLDMEGKDSREASTWVRQREEQRGETWDGQCTWGQDVQQTCADRTVSRAARIRRADGHTWRRLETK